MTFLFPIFNFRLDIYRKVPRDLTQPTTTGAIISIVCVSFIFFMVISDLVSFLTLEIRSELFVDDPGREGRIKVHLNVSLPYLSCNYIGVDIQDDNGRHEVGFVQNTEKVPIAASGCRFEANFEVSKVPGNFHLSTHAAERQPQKYDMRHKIHSVAFGDDILKGTQHLGSFNPLKGREDLHTDGTFTHDYVLKVSCFKPTL
ncbi:unnamed protein product [Gongylonema pulchrum]|uniref:ERGIC_N domain-containing protein n=1 Tax=Gongylonema pulchrum TaxID=637853 RepID=A0A183CVM9_9BILA|nr:unnamed protein product [Gongylonema pulchrum]